MEAVDMEAVDEDSHNENIFNETRYLDCMEVEDSSEFQGHISAEARALVASEARSLVSSEGRSLVSGDASCEELVTQVEVVSDVSQEIPFTFDWNVLFQPKRLHPRLEEILYWRDALKSFFIFTTGFIILLAFDRCSVIFVVPFLLLHIMLASVASRMYRAVMRATDNINSTNTNIINNHNNNDNNHNINNNHINHNLNNNNTSDEEQEPNPEWVEYENLVVTLQREKVQIVTGVTVERINELIGHLKNLFLFKNPNDSMHFGLFLISLALLGKMINGSTMLILIFLFVFTVPKLYEMNKPAIDAKFGLMRKHFIIMANKLRGAIEYEF